MARYRLVPIDAETGEIIRSPRTYQWVKYAVLGPRGGIIPLAKAPAQRFTKKDYEGLNRTISGKKDFIVYEELTRRYARDPKTDKPIPQPGKYRTTKSGKRVPVYYRETKITFLQPKRRQRPTLYSGSSRRRALDIGFQKLSPRQQADQKSMVMVTPSRTKPIRYEISGNSVRDALSNLVLALDRDKIYDDEGKKVAGLYYNIIIHLTKPDGSVLRIPASGSLAVLEKFKDVFPQLATKVYRAEGETAFRKEVRTLANMQREVGHAITQSLKNSGYRFTSLANLKVYAGQMTKEKRRLMRDAKQLRKEGKIKQAEKKERSWDRVNKARNKMINELPKKKMIRRKDYKLDIQIEFERIPVK